MRFYGFCTDCFGTVHWRTAAEGNNSFAFIFGKNLISFFNVDIGGVGFDFVKNAVSDILFFHSFEHGIKKAHAHKFFVSNNEHVFDILFFDPGGKLFDAACAFDIFRHAIGHDIVSDLHSKLKSSAKKFFHKNHAPS